MANLKIFATLILIFTTLISGCTDKKTLPDAQEFLNVSYDSTRELYAAYNEKFKTHWEKEFGNGKITLIQSHGGSAN